MMKIFVFFALILTGTMLGVLYILKRYMHGRYNGIWYIVASCVYLCMLFGGAIYFFGIPL